MAAVPPEFLCLAYPCNVDGGVDPVEFVRLLLDRQNPNLRNIVVQLLEVDPNTTDDELIERAEGLRNNWNFSVTQDETNMRPDHTSALDSFGRQLIPHGHSEFIDQFGNEHITSVRAFLMHYDQEHHRGIRLLYLIGHAISIAGANALNDHPADDTTSKSEVWPWRLYDCSVERGINRLPSQVTGEARKGDLVVFSSGLLTPEWVIDVLRGAEVQRQNQINNTIVIVVDACYSGRWVERMRTALNKRPLNGTRILLQTSCGPDEVAYGKLFTPQFVNQNLDTHYEVDQAAPTQTPHFFDSDNPDNPDAPPQGIRIETANITFRFISNQIGQGGGNPPSRNDTFRTFVPFN